MWEILYLGERDRTASRALGRYGRVHRVESVDEAIFLMAERDFHYYFIDADTPKAGAFIKHLHHDPQLPAPRGIVLLTMNDEEDCDAWGVDTFVSLPRIREDLPFIFSHLKGGEHDEGAVHILSVAGSGATPSGSPRVEPDESMGRQGVAGGSEDGRAAREVAFLIEELRHGKARRAETRAPGQKRPRYLKLAGAALLAVGFCLWLFTTGPLSGGSKKAGVGSRAAKVSAGTESGKDNPRESGVYQERLPEGYESPVMENTAPPASLSTAAPEPGRSPTQDAADENVSQVDGVAGFPSPAVPEVNRPPDVTVSGPTEVLARQTATYIAVSSDPDGDGVSLSWGGPSKSFCWSTPGLYTVTVTATDSRGASSSGSLSVRVI